MNPPIANACTLPSLENGKTAHYPFARKNTDVLFVSDRIDELGLDVYEFRVLAHLISRCKKGTRTCWPGIRGIAKKCRMCKNTVERAIGSLEHRGLIEVERRAGGVNVYALEIVGDLLFVHRRLDDYGLTPTQFRVLAHCARLADTGGLFFISKRKFARVCGIKRDTVGHAIVFLQ